MGERSVGVARWAVILLMPVVLTLNNLYLLMTPGFLAVQYGLGMPASVRFTDEERIRFATDTLINVRSPTGLERLAALADEEGPLYNDRELHHMADVQVLVDRVLLTHAAAAVLILASGAVLWRAGRRQAVLAALLRGGVFTLALAGAVGLFAVLGFSAFFVQFHESFFPPGTWMFPASDTLIQLFPLPFWFRASVAWLGLTALQGAVAAAGVRYLQRRGA